MDPVPGPGPTGTIGTVSEPRWLSPIEQRAWRAFLFAYLLVDERLDTQLRRDSHIALDYYGMLARLSEAPGRALRMSDLAASTASSPSRLTHAVTNLEKLGWVVRQPCPNDRRVQYAVLTDAGFAVLEGAAPGHVEAVRQTIFDALSDEQIAQLDDVMTTLVRHLNPEVADRAGIEVPATADR